MFFDGSNINIKNKCHVSVAKNEEFDGKCPDTVNLGSAFVCLDFAKMKISF